MNKATEGYIADLHYYMWIQPMAADAYDLDDPSVENIVEMIETTEEYGDNILSGVDVIEVAREVQKEMVRKYAK